MIGWIATGLTIIGAVANARHVWWCWYVWLASCVIGGVYATIIWEPSIIAQNAAYVVSNLYGLYMWRRVEPPK